MPPTIIWLALAGAIALIAGSYSYRFDAPIAWGSVFVAVPLAVFGAEHLAIARGIAEGVPAWLPGRLFIAYFVGVAHLSAALSLIAKRYTRFSIPLIALMFFGFITLIHWPNVIRQPTHQFLSVALRDTCFFAGSLAMAGRTSKPVVWIARALIAVALVTFGVQYLMHPELAPGLPLQILTPTWVPVPHLWDYLTGIALILGGLGILVDAYAVRAAAGVGALMIFITVVLYAPMWAMADRAGQLLGVNGVADTMLFGGMMLWLAQAMDGTTSTTPRSTAAV